MNITISPMGLVIDAIQLLILIILAQVVISYLIQFGMRISRYNPIVRTIDRIANTVLEPVRKLIPPYKTGGWDLSPVVVIVLLQVVAGMFYR